MKITTRFFNFILGLSVFTQFVMLAPAHSQAFPESPTPALSESAPVQVENSNNGSAEASASKPQDSPEAGTQPSPTTSQTSATTTESQAVSETNALPTTSAEDQVPPPEVQTSPSSDPSQPTPENAQSSASENQVIPENGASQADKTSQSESSSNSKALDGLNQELNQGKNESIELDSEKRTGFSLLRSQDLADYQRTRGIWVSDSGNGRIIYMKNLRGEDFYPLGISGSGVGHFLNPEQIWVDLEGKIYVADRGNNRVVRIDNITGMGWVEMSNDFLEPRGVAFHGKRLFVSDTGNDRILVYEKFGDLTPMAELKDEKIKKPGYLWLDLEGNLYVCCGDNNLRGQIVRIPFDLTVLPNQWKVYKGQGLKGASFAPTQLVQDDNGTYFIDSANQRLVKADNFKGRNPWEIGGYGRGYFQFLEPKGVSLDEEGHLYIADTGNDRIVCVDLKEGARKWQVYDTTEPNFGLRSPKCVFVWSPRPEPETKDEEEDEKGKSKKSSK